MVTYIRRGGCNGGFLRYEFVGPIFGGAYTRRDLFSEFYGILSKREDDMYNSSFEKFYVIIACCEDILQ